MEFSDEQVEYIQAFVQAFNEGEIFIIPAKHKVNGEIYMCITLQSDEDENSVVPLGILFNHGEEFDNYDFPQEEELVEGVNFVYNDYAEEEDDMTELSWFSRLRSWFSFRF